MNSQKNHLAEETSLYLQQHATNPVDWHPWNEQTLQLAKESNKPILLSIGYSACHWCHVMAHESFENSEIADLMNHNFINIKVDREERPDIDKIYQTALQILTGKSGGWPLTLFLTPQQLPFFGGTYFPSEARSGIPSFKEVLTKVADIYQQNPKNIEDIAAKIQVSLKQLEQPPAAKDRKLSPQVIQHAKQQLAREFDCAQGGFGGAPKFPYPNYLTFLLRNGYANKSNQESYAMVSRSLIKMAEGGIYDQLGSGFYRYSVDAAWLIPHFEKMLYDNAQLLLLYVQMFQITNNSFFKDIATDIGRWILKDLQNADGGYFSALAADTEGHEGKFYVWSREEIQKILPAEEYKAIEKYWGIDLPANFENHWHLFVADSTENSQLIHSAKQKLFAARALRTHPQVDTKIVISWNALMIKSLAVAGIVLDQKDFISSAERALHFIMQNEYQNKNKIKFLDDYAFLLDTLIFFLQYQWSPTYAQWAKEVATALLEKFYDKSHGGFYFTSSDSEKLIQKPKYLMDEATPSGNGIAILNLIRLSYLLDENNYFLIAEQSLLEAWGAISSYAAGYCSLLNALEEYFSAPTIIVLRGEAFELREWQRLFFQHYLPNHLCFTIESEADLPTTLQKPAPATGVSAYICQGKTCQEPIQDKQKFIEYLNIGALSSAGT